MHQMEVPSSSKREIKPRRVMFPERTNHYERVAMNPIQLIWESINAATARIRELQIGVNKEAETSVTRRARNLTRMDILDEDTTKGIVKRSDAERIKEIKKLEEDVVILLTGLDAANQHQRQDEKFLAALAYIEKCLERDVSVARNTDDLHSHPGSRAALRNALDRYQAIADFKLICSSNSRIQE